MATVTRHTGPCRIATEGCAFTTFLRAEGIAPTVEVTTYSPCVDEHMAAVDLVAERMASGDTEGMVQEIIDGKHGRIGIGLRMPREEYYEWWMPDGSRQFTKLQVPPEAKS